MLKTALKPKWILALVGALLLASGFVLLSQWQFSRSQDAPPPPVSTTESAVPLTDHFEPETVMFESVADQVVSAEGHFLKGKEVLVRDRVQGGVQGFWVVSALAVDGAPDKNTIPVVRGWQPDSTTPPAPPAGELEVTGRLLPTEAPIDKKPDGDPALRSLSVAELINIWNVPSYSGFIVASEVTGPDGADVGSTSAGLDEVNVGPQPQDQPLNWLNIFYGIEWVVFAGFAVFLWWRLVVDDYRRQQEDIEDALAEAQAATIPPNNEDPQ